MLVFRIILDTEKAIDNFFNSFNFKKFSIDTETTGFNEKKDYMVGASVYDGGAASFYIPVAHRQGTQVSKEYIIPRFIEKFKQTEELIFHNAKFDVKFLKSFLGKDCFQDMEYVDSMLAHYLLDENTNHKLKDLAIKFLGKNPETFVEVIQNYENASYVPIKEMAPYACDDAINTWELYALLKKKLKEEKLYEYFKTIEMPFVKVLIDMEEFGCNFDTGLLQHYINVVEARIEELELIVCIKLKGGVQVTFDGKKYPAININSPKDLKQKLFSKYTPVMFTEKGSIKVDSEHYKKLLKITSDEVFTDLIEHKKLQKLYTAYLLPYKAFSEGGRIFYDIIQQRTRTGRLSSANPNIMQLPRPHTKDYKPYVINGEEIEVRKLFLPDDGYQMIAGDYAQEEVRIAAVLANDTYMFKAFNEGYDPHLASANLVFGLNLTDKQLTEGSVEYDRVKGKHKEKRQQAKGITFGLLYGKTKESFAKTLNMTKDEAGHLVDDYFNAYPKIRQAVDKTNYEVKHTGFVRDMFGRKRRFIKEPQGYYKNSCYRQAFNFKIQGTSATILKKVCLDIYNALKGTKARILYTVHDELVLQVPEEETEEYKVKIQKIMEEVIELPIKLPAELNSGDNYYAAK